MSKYLPLDLFIRQALLYPLDSPFLPPENKVLKNYSYAAGKKTGSLISPVILDLMEYPNNAAAQLAYVSSGAKVYSADLCIGGTPFCSTYYPLNPPAKAFDDDLATFWITDTGHPTGYIGYDLGEGNSKIIQKYTLNPGPVVNAPRIFKDWTFQGSNTGAWGGEEVTLDTQVGVTDWEDGITKVYTFSNSTAYRYYRVNVTLNGGDPNYIQTAEVEMMEVIDIALQCYSESTIVLQGTYSLKGIAVATDSLNETLTRTLSPPVNLAGKDTWTFYIYASRTGSNIKVGLHDGGGVTTEVTPNVISAGAWRKVEADISGVADADKDYIDKITLTVVEAGALNVFYFDEMKAA